MRIKPSGVTFRLAVASMAAFAIVACCARWYAAYTSPGSRYQRTKSHADLMAAFTGQLRPGMTYEEVKKIIGPGDPTPPDYVDQYLRLQEEGKWPAGYAQPGDRVFQYRSDARIVYGLGFRNGRLVNFNPSEYETENDVEIMMSSE